MRPISVVAVDVGALANIGWFRRGASSSGSASGRDLDSLVDVIVGDVRDGVPVALGFEAPLFIPRPVDAAGLNRQRIGESGRPWCAGAGTVALALGLQQATYVFSTLAREVRPRVTFELDAVERGDADLLVWEAFVSGEAKDREAAEPHVDDARRAVAEFSSRLDRGTVTSDVEDTNVLNVSAAGLLSSGLTDDLAMLTMSCIVVKPPVREPDDLSPGR